MASSVSELQNKLFRRMGLDVPEVRESGNARGRRPGYPKTRKEQRKAHRVEKKTHIYSKPSQPVRRTGPPVTQRKQNGRPQQSQTKSILKSAKPSKRLEESDDDEGDEDDEDEEEGMSLGEDESEDGDIFDEDDDDDEAAGDDDEEDEDVDDSKAAKKTTKVPKAVQDRLAQDDAEIAAFERKLGIKKGRKGLPESFKEDGLGDLMEDLEGEGDSDSDEDDNKKRKSEYDDWLASKRRKTAQASGSAKRGNQEDDDDLSMEDGLGSEDDELDFDEDDEDENMGGFDDDEFDGFDSDGDDKAPPQPRHRENPYVAPTTGVTVAKYVPPSLRKAAGTEDENRSRLMKQVQGLINRLTDANLLSIVQSIEELYQKNARGDVTEIITDAIMAQICKPESLPDQFFVLTGGFAAATYRLIGSSFGSHLIRRVVSDFGSEYDRAAKDTDGTSGIQKEASNIITLLSQLYIFEVVTCKILFDYMEKLLGDLSEMNVELLLRICRMAGPLMRKDDPQSLKHVAGVLNQSVAKAGYNNTSARTKFMVETITGLKNSKSKARGLDSAVVSEHVQRMKKRLGELKSQTRRQEGLAPMGIGLVDVEGADTRGKWWLVGASVPNNLVKAKKGSGDKGKAGGDNESSDEEDMDIVLPDYPNKARAQGLSGTAQIAIFTALMSAPNYDQGYRQFQNLRLKKDDQLEIARVLIQCVGSEVQYNPYYALVGRQACANGKVRFAFQDRLWKIFRGLGESLFGEEPDDDETADGERMKDERRMSNVARFYASLVVDGALTITLLKPLELPELNHWTSIFVQWFIIALLQECKGKNTAKEDARVEKHFGAARELPGLAAGIHWILRKKIRKSKLLGAKEAKKLDGVREKAQAAVQAVEV